MGNTDSMIPGEQEASEGGSAMGGLFNLDFDHGVHDPAPQRMQKKRSAEKNVSPVEGCANYDPARSKELCVVEKAHEEYVRILVYDRWRNAVISGGGDGKIRCWNANTLKLFGVPIETASVRSLLVLERMLVSGHPDGKVRCWAAANSAFEMDGGPVWSCRQELSELNEAVYALVYIPGPEKTMRGPSGTLLVGAEKIIAFTWQQGAWCPSHSVGAEVLCMCSLGDNSGFVATGNMDRVVYVWDSVNWKSTKKLTGHDRSVWDVACIDKPGCTKLLSASADNTIRVRFKLQNVCKF